MFTVTYITDTFEKDLNTRIQFYEYYIFWRHTHQSTTNVIRTNHRHKKTSDRVDLKTTETVLDGCNKRRWQQLINELTHHLQQRHWEKNSLKKKKTLH